MDVLNTLVSILAGAATTGLVTICTHLYHSKQSADTEDDTIKDGMMALLHDRIYQAGHYYCNVQGWCSLQDKHNIDYMYKPYHALGGNGTGTAAYKAILALPTEPPTK